MKKNLSERENAGTIDIYAKSAIIEMKKYTFSIRSLRSLLEKVNLYLSLVDKKKNGNVPQTHTNSIRLVSNCVIFACILTAR